MEVILSQTSFSAEKYHHWVSLEYVGRRAGCMDTFCSGIYKRLPSHSRPRVIPDKYYKMLHSKASPMLKFCCLAIIGEQHEPFLPSNTVSVGWWIYWFCHFFKQHNSYFGDKCLSFAVIKSAISRTAGVIVIVQDWKRGGMGGGGDLIAPTLQFFKKDNQLSCFLHDRKS